MANRYFFDKRDMKRGLLKYLIIFVISFIPIVFINILLAKVIDKDWLIIFIDCVILLVFVVIGSMIANKIFDRKDAKLRAKIKAREEMEERKKQILEDSYKKIREEKKNKKKQNTDDVIVVEEKKNKTRRK